LKAQNRVSLVVPAQQAQLVRQAQLVQAKQAQLVQAKQAQLVRWVGRFALTRKKHRVPVGRRQRTSRTSS
jgi:hypothetical protein